jgi:hypothetical protein
MQLGFRTWRFAAAMAFALVPLGCQQFEDWRQGDQSEYKKELRQIAENVNRDEVAKSERGGNLLAESKNDEVVVQTNHWHATTLTGAVRLEAPIPED